MLRVNNLSKKYNDVKAVNDASFVVNEGEVAVLVGSNGAGKSTTIQSIMGLLRFEGEVLVDGIDNHDLQAKKMLAYVPEIPSMYPLLTVREHIEYMAKAYGEDLVDEEVDALLARFELSDKQDKLGDELSKGMMQKVSICCALITKPKVLILDEPMVGLDPKAIKELKNVVMELKELNTTIIISTHMMEMVDALWDRIILMKEGKIMVNLTREESGDSDLEELFFRLTEQRNEDVEVVEEIEIVKEIEDNDGEAHE